jgi:Arc/MetJ-type ribon-helix-helix transcriptional regulator
MISCSRSFAIIALLTAAILPAAAQRHRDPLTSQEIDQVRDASWEPKQRLALYLQFARARLVKLEEMRNDPKTKNRPRQTHDLLDDFQLLYDELNDNIDTYVDRHDDIRKPLKLVIDADTEFQAKLRALKDAADVKPEEAQAYEFVLNNLLETVDTSAADHRKLLTDQEDAAKHKKLNSNSTAKNGGRSE